jgi:hypothetical protein
MEQTGFYSKKRSGLDFIDPAKITAGQQKKPNVFILAETTAIAIDSIPANTPAGTIIVNTNGFWGVSGSVQAKEIIDVSSGTLPSSGVLKDDIYLIGVGGTVNGINLVSGDKLQAKIDNPTQNETNLIFDDWFLIPAPKASSANIQRPNGDSVELALTENELLPISNSLNALETKAISLMKPPKKSNTDYRLKIFANDGSFTQTIFGNIIFNLNATTGKFYLETEYNTFSGDLITINELVTLGADVLQITVNNQTNSNINLTIYK